MNFTDLSMLIEIDKKSNVNKSKIQKNNLINNNFNIINKYKNKDKNKDKNKELTNLWYIFASE